ncbi:MAG: ATP-binding protein [Bacteroidota bacterium]
MFKSIIRNLVFNAVKYTPHAGKVTVGARPVPGNSVRIFVRDTGMGMDKHILGNLFHLDNQVNRKGTDNEPTTGLGLIICKDFVETHGGKIWAESEEGKGSTFYFTLPVDI